MEECLFSIIIPQRNSLHTLPKLLSSIPESMSIEVIIVDNSDYPIEKNAIESNRKFQLFWASPERCAGGARNVGLEHACGRWVLFADADDYFAENAFETFFDQVDSKADIVYFSSQGIYADTGLPSDRGQKYTNRVKSYLLDKNNDLEIRLSFSVPWSKMIRRELIERFNLRFDEIPASNDMNFSMKAGFYAREIKAIDKIVYIVTTSKGSLTRRRDLKILESRYGAYLSKNKFLREHGLSHMQSSVMYYLYNSIHFGPLVFFRFLYKAISMHQNIFVGFSRWLATMSKVAQKENQESKYIVK